MNSNRHKSEIAEVSAFQPTQSSPASQKPALTGEAQHDFIHLLKQLSEGICKEDIKQREGWRDRKGKTHYVDYVEWHRVADVLDKIAPTWSHSVRYIVQIGEFVAATAAITINGITREGVGTGPADTETGIKKAEHDALKRAAVKFGVGRDLYRDEEKGSESSQHSSRAGNPRESNPIARTLDQLVTPKQLTLIKKLANNAGLDPDGVCWDLYKAKLEEISRRTASALIDHLQSEQP